MRRKRKTRYTWIHTTFGDEYDTAEFSSGVIRSLTIPAAAAASTLDVFTCITDASPEEEPGASDKLVDQIGSSLFLKRIVGKCYCSVQQDSNNTNEAVVIGAGFFIARCQPRDEASPTQLPIGFTDGSNADDFQNYSPLAQATMREPWIWRRTWVLGNNALTAATGNGGSQFYPATNASRSVLDGPHIDAKTARRASGDERLFFAWQAATLSANAVGADVDTTLHLDARFLGAVRRERNRSVF